MGSPWLKFYPTDWRADPRLRMCSLAARGLWIELIGYMHEAEPYGHLLINDAAPSLEDIAALVGRPLAEVRKAFAELEARQVFSNEGDAIYSRRMVRDKAKADKDRENGKDGGNPEIRRGTVPKDQRVRPFRRSDAPEKTLRIFAKTGGKCHWCDVDLIFVPDGSPNGYHVDHVLPVCDGGTNDEDNLVPACAACNHKRARNENPTASPVIVGNVSDIKAQIPEARYQKPESETRAGPPDWPGDYREQFWQAFPNKVGKPNALTRLERLHKRGDIRWSDLMAGLQNYIRTKPVDRQWLNPATFLNQERWADQPAANVLPMRRTPDV